LGEKAKALYNRRDSRLLAKKFFATDFTNYHGLIFKKSVAEKKPG
jgi:hypothetical protein